MRARTKHFLIFQVMNLLEKLDRKPIKHDSTYLLVEVQTE
jgi:hypothetical protein